VEAWRNKPSDAAAAEIHAATEPRRLELLRRLNLAPQATRTLVEMRGQLLDTMVRREDLAVIDADFAYMFSTWFNRGFLVLRRIDWSTPAVVLEKIIRYEAVHQIRDWVDLRARIDTPDRRCYAFFHPALVDEPLIFVEVALTREIPGAIAPILELKREPLDPERATTAVFYSISNCQRGLAGVTFGSFLIKQVVAEICREMPRLSTFVTLSPVPNFAGWLARQRTEPSPALAEADRAALAGLDRPEWWNDEAAVDEIREPMLRAAATYFMTARNAAGAPLDAVAPFHLGNGASLERLNWPADLSDRGRRQAWGLMVNYRYDLGDIEKNHEAYADNRAIIAASAIRKLARPSRAITTVETAT
jgi:malonyl-CoA decarboxylase